MRTKIAFTMYTENKVHVEVVGWGEPDHWNWNVYLHISKESRLYNVDAEKLPFHRGQTLDNRETTEPFDLKYEWQKKHITRKIGSDYSHLYDDFSRCSPFNGIPAQIENDANALIKILKK